MEQEKQIEIVSKEDAAIIQLNDAIELYYNGRYISAITLAGAADDILGRLSGELFSDVVGTKTRFDHTSISASMIALTLSNIRDGEKEISEDERTKIFKEIEKEFIKEWTETRNQLKHKKIKEENFVEAESFKAVAEFHISNAIFNYKLYRKEYPENEPLILKYRLDRGIY